MRCPQCGERETRVVDSRDLVFFVSVIGFALFVTGVILRGHRAG